MFKQILFLSALLCGLAFATRVNTQSSTSAFSNTKTLKLDGSSKYVDFGNNYNLSTGADSFSVVGWAYFTDGTTTFQGVFDKQNPSSPFQGYTLLWNSSGGGLQTLRFQLSSTNIKFLDVRTSSTYTLSAWHFIGLTYDGSTVPSGVKIYVDSNTPETLTTITNQLDTASTSTTQPLRMGYSQGNAKFLAGNLNQWRYFSGTVLSSSDIATLYNSGHPYQVSSYSGQSSYWYFNQSDSSSTITDHTGAINGTGVSLVSGDFVSATPSPP